MFKKEDIELDDGKFEAVFVKKPKSQIEILNLIFKVLSGDLKDENIYYFKTSNIKITSKEPIEISIDGEYGGSRTEIEVKNMEKNVQYIVPKNKYSNL